MRNAEWGMRNVGARLVARDRAPTPSNQFRIPHSSGGSMTSHTHYLWFNTKSRQEIIDVTEQVAQQVAESGVEEGLVLVSAMHITASVFVNDHESGLWADILKWLETTVAPWDPKRYRHNETGEDNAAAHLARGPKRAQR